MLINVQNVIMISDLLKMCALASFPCLYVTTHLRVLSSKNLKKIFIYMYFCNWHENSLTKLQFFYRHPARTPYWIFPIPQVYWHMRNCIPHYTFVFTFKLAPGGTLTLVVVVSTLPDPLLCRILRELC